MLDFLDNMDYIYDMSSNASATVFGFEFQVYAGIYLMIKHLGHMSRLKVEGPSQDIELTLKNGSTIYAQAKAFTRPYDEKMGVRTNKLTNSLRTLSSISAPLAHQLVYITNLQIPPIKTTTPEFDGRYYLKYNELSEQSRNEINRILKRNGFSVDLDKLTLVAFPFYGENSDQKLKAIIVDVREMLHKIDPTIEGAALSLLEHWCSVFLTNGAFKDDSICISIDEITWDLIMEGIRKMGNDGICQALGLDTSAFDEAIQEYDGIIQFEDAQFKNFNLILQMYDSYCAKLGRNCNISEFIMARSEEIFSTIFGKNQDDGRHGILMICAQIVAYKILRRRGFIQRIKERINQYDNQ